LLLLLLLFNVVPYAAPSLASICRIASLNDKVPLDIKEGAVVVVVELAELQEVFAE
jgi:hypothetical protein